MNLDERSNELQTSTNRLIERLTLLINTTNLVDGQQDVARAWRERLERARERATARLSVAFIAQVGRGKSTLIAAATGFRMSEGKSPRKWSVLPVGDGRTTLGETRIHFEERSDIQLEVEPISSDELRTELRLFSRDLWAANEKKGDSSGSAGQGGEELYDLLRTWLAPGEEDSRKVLDGLARLAADAGALEQVLLSRLDLELRSQPIEHRFSNDPNGLTELNGKLMALMAGEWPGAPAPRIVRLRVPMTDLGRVVETVIDTQGIDSRVPEAAIRGRQDLQDLIRDPDTLLVLCSEFESAPDAVTTSLLKALPEIQGHAMRERSLRLVIVDRREVDDDPGDQRRQRTVQIARVAQCRDVLRREELLLPDELVIAIDARSDAAALQQMIIGMANETRLHRGEKWQRTFDDAFRASSAFDDIEFAAETREMDLRMWWAWDAALAEAAVVSVDGLAALKLFIPIGLEHWSHLNAAIRRRGRYHQLDLATSGALTASRLMSIPYWMAIGKVKAFVAEMSVVVDQRLTKHLELQLERFVRATDSYGTELFQSWRQLLSGYFASAHSDELWSWCEARWGGGPGYVRDIADRFHRESSRAGLELKGNLLPAPLEKGLPLRPNLFSLRNVRLRNFRGIEQRSIPLAETMTVFVGDNGLGKTGWLEAVAAAVGALLPGMGAGPAPELTMDDVRQVIRELAGVPDRQYQFPMEIEIDAMVQGRPLRWSRRIEAVSGEADAADDALQVMARQIGEDVRSHSTRQLPVLAYYGTQRLWPPALQPDLDRREVGSRLDGYRDCLEAASTHRHMLEWVRHFTLVELQRKRPVKQLQAVLRAVVSCIEEAERFSYDLALEDLTLTLRDGQVFAFRMLSDGYRNIIAMVADIAWRASVLNPQLGDRSAELAEGVVLIDEIDLHLHPRWQRRVLADLRRAFPRLQFITTTHSPFIIQSLQPGQLANLDLSAKDAPYAGESPEDIVEHIMGVDLPQRSERRRREFEVAMQYYDLLDRVPDADEAQLALLKDKLDEILMPYTENQALVAFLARKRVLAEARRS